MLQAAREREIHVLDRKEGRKCFIYDTFNTFYLRLYGVGHMVKDYLDSERGNPLLPLHGLFFLISSKGSFICTIPDRISYTTTFVIPVAERWLEQDILDRYQDNIINNCNNIYIGVTFRSLSVCM